MSKYVSLDNLSRYDGKIKDLIEASISNFVTKSVDDLTNYYTKSQTYTQTEVNNLINAISTINILVVDTLPVQDISTTTIYLVHKSTSQTSNAYDEYIYVSDGEPTPTYSWEKIGDTEIDLSDYITTSELNTALTEYTTTTDLTTLLAGKQNTIDSSHKLSANLIEETNTKKFLDSSGLYQSIDGDKAFNDGIGVNNHFFFNGSEFDFSNSEDSGVMSYNENDDTVYFGKPVVVYSTPTNQYDVANKKYVDEIIQRSTMPTASVDYLNKIFQYTGTTTSTYTNGYFYKCVSDGQSPATYSWENINIQPVGSNTPTQYVLKSTFAYVGDTTLAINNLNTQDNIDIMKELYNISNTNEDSFPLGNIKLYDSHNEKYFSAIEYHNYNQTYQGSFSITFEITYNNTAPNIYGINYKNRQRVEITAVFTNGEITGLNANRIQLEKIMDSGTSNSPLGVNNTTSYTPTNDYNPATKKYVDDNTNNKITQYSTMPTASSSTVDKIVQYIGTTGNGYTNGYFYIGITDGESTPTYSWQQIDVQPNSGSGSSFIISKLNLYGTSSNPIILDTLSPGKYIIRTGQTNNDTYFKLSSTETAVNLSLGSTVILEIYKQVDASSLSNNDILAIVYNNKSSDSSTPMTRYKTLLYNPAATGKLSYETFTDAMDEVVNLDGNQEISGKKTFTTLPESLVAPTTDYQLTNKTYVDSKTDSKVTQYSVMPTASSALEGKIAQYAGNTDASYTNGYFYKCVSDGASTPTYSWQQFDVQPGGSSSYDYIINAGSAIDTSSIYSQSSVSGTITDSDVISQLNRIIADGVYDSNYKLKQYKIGLYISGPYYDDSMFLSSASIVDNTADTYDEPNFGNYLCYSIIFTLNNHINLTIYYRTEDGGTTYAWDYYTYNAGSALTTLSNQLSSKVTQYSTMPTASSSFSGKIVQYTGTTDSTYTKGYFYQCVGTSSGGTTTYSWNYVDVNRGSVYLSYGNSTWQDFIDAYNSGRVVYCKASSNADPSSGAQTRMSFMAYINSDPPTTVEFQYFRSVDSKNISNPVDQIFVYKLTNVSGGTWSVTTRNVALKPIAGNNILLGINGSGASAGFRINCINYATKYKFDTVLFTTSTPMDAKFNSESISTDSNLKAYINDSSYKTSLNSDTIKVGDIIKFTNDTDSTAIMEGFNDAGNDDEYEVVLSSYYHNDNNADKILFSSPIFTRQYNSNDDVWYHCLCMVAYDTYSNRLYVVKMPAMI